MSAVAVIVLQKAARISELLEEKVGVKGVSLEAQLGRARRILPRDARLACWRIAEAERRAQRGGIVDVDARLFDDDYRMALRHLQALEPGSLRSAVLRAVLTGGATALASGVMLGVGLVYAGLI